MSPPIVLLTLMVANSAIAVPFKRLIPNPLILENTPTKVSTDRLVCQHKEDDRSAAAVVRYQELLASYFISAFRRVETCLGKGQWRRETDRQAHRWLLHASRADRHRPALPDIHIGIPLLDRRR